MKFKQPCFIRKNNPKLRKGLEELGYTPNSYELFWDDNRYLITFISPSGFNGFGLCVTDCCILYNKSYIDCGDNEDLFLALAALRDDTDYMQWFTDGTEWYQNRQNDIEVIRYGASDPINFHKATVNELIDHFKNNDSN